MRSAHPVAQVRAAEAALMARLPTGTLMQRAAAGLAHRVAQQLGARHGGVYGGRIALLVGRGNNGADALWAGSRLARRGARVEALTLGDVDATARAALLRAGGRCRPAENSGTLAVLAAADVVVDGILGIGGRGALRGVAAALADQLPGPATGATVVAVDLPSGVDADTGVVAGPAVRADITVTFGTLKPGLVLAPGSAYAGSVELVDIGLAGDLPPTTTPGWFGRDRSRPSTAAAYSGWSPAATPIRVQPCSPSAERCGPAPGWCASPRSRPPPSWCASAGRSVWSPWCRPAPAAASPTRSPCSVPAGCRPG